MDSFAHSLPSKVSELTVLLDLELQRQHPRGLNLLAAWTAIIKVFQDHAGNGLIDYTTAAHALWKDILRNDVVTKFVAALQKMIDHTSNTEDTDGQLISALSRGASCLPYLVAYVTDVTWGAELERAQDTRLPRALAVLLHNGERLLSSWWKSFAAHAPRWLSQRTFDEHCNPWCQIAFDMSGWIHNAPDHARKAMRVR